MQRSHMLALAALLILALTLAAALIYRERQALERELAIPVPADIDTSDIIGMPRPDFRFPDHEGRPRQAAEWDGDVLMVNFWATWCIPCRREIPALIELQARYGMEGLQVVGIALDEQQLVERFLAGLDVEVNYPVLVSPDMEGVAVARDWGNAFGILPYTVLVDRNGRIAYAHFGELTYADAEREVAPLM